MRQRKQFAVVVASAILICTLVTGCWDRTELNDRALVMASGLDLDANGRWLLTDQVIIPVNLAKQESITRQSFLTLSATGKDLVDAGQLLQTKLSRQYFLGHRRVIFIGEEAARHGLTGIMDEYTRNPDVRLRSDIFVVRGARAIDALEIKAPLEQYPGLTIIKSRRFVGGTVGDSLRGFLIAAASQTSCATLPVLEIVPETVQSTNKTFAFTGRAIFNKELKVVGYLDFSDANYRLWVTNDLKKRQITFQIPGHPGYATVDLSQFAGRVHAIVQYGHPRFEVELTGQGLLRENQTNLNVKDPKQLKQLNDAMQHEVNDEVTQLIAKVQKQYKTDIFGFDQALARQQPKQWKVMKLHWNELFPEAHFNVATRLKIKTVGLTSKNPVSSKLSQGYGSW
ncbi:Ger(x)C family spore germination protein [Alicyclobacillus sp. ALC3]|uniref:Ger(x)C family spore germination protein n=1 Tax=Alicyclobacillus sp. ALC3 TaxID=2796143 RepID=UPI002379E9F9|nr:Ger(x)C family spore germination protein [Alicyclobacillus sp. ALC3]WDL96057.1 Ger(x)C family spore germination protein [Alicyclobacillus sp. ALC3]